MTEYVDNTIYESTMDTEDTAERTVDIYVTAETVRDIKHRKEKEHPKTTTIQSPQHTGSDPIKKRSFREATVCLGLLCVLLLAAVIVLCVELITNTDQFNIKSKKFAEERDQLLTKNTNLTEERACLIFTNENVTKERDKLIIRVNNLTSESDQLKKLKTSLETLDGWIYYQYRFYYFSSEMMNWNESRRYCRERGADLLIINNTKEQDFVREITKDNIWIGLTDSDKEGTWKWVDGSTLTAGDWRNGEPSGGTSENCCVLSSAKLTDCPCNAGYKWMCEKTILQ
ncbi:C-type lectin domain family 4 member M-like isoform X3 [Myxocyprinus asiaticus]|uniref:C-type lectin domain family 4 member M-like isoform X3 n=1 Tax=Myxocyprinus asiaticus TaxID=70543 RepID=UPI002221B37B|nr:C-type lectin domain family 4 member M-like isoform X3 [Myxocyprinus asiaticus]